MSITAGTSQELIDALVAANELGADGSTCKTAQTTIVLNPTEYSLTEDYADTGTGVPQILCDITIKTNDGSAIIKRNASVPFRILLVNGNDEQGKLTLQNITIENGSLENQNGAGIYNDGTLKLHQSTVKNNTIGSVDYPHCNSTNGAGIYNTHILEIEQSTVTMNKILVHSSCSGPYRGGGIFSLSKNDVINPLTITDSEISFNEVPNEAGDYNKYGGGIAIHSNTFSPPAATAWISNSVITENSGHSGGGVWVNESLTLQNSLVSLNSASVGGGMLIEIGFIDIKGTKITGNTVWNRGGGIYLSGSQMGVENSLISNNYAPNEGGGIYVDDGQFNITGSALQSNIANDDVHRKPGGAIFSRSTSAGSTIDDSCIMENDSESDVYVIAPFSPVDVVVENNWWGVDTGPCGDCIAAVGEATVSSYPHLTAVPPHGCQPVEVLPIEICRVDLVDLGDGFSVFSNPDLNSPPDPIGVTSTSPNLTGYVDIVGIHPASGGLRSYVQEYRPDVPNPGWTEANVDGYLDGLVADTPTYACQNLLLLTADGSPVAADLPPETELTDSCLFIPDTDLKLYSLEDIMVNTNDLGHKGNPEDREVEGTLSSHTPILIVRDGGLHLNRQYVRVKYMSGGKDTSNWIELSDISVNENSQCFHENEYTGIFFMAESNLPTCDEPDQFVNCRPPNLPLSDPEVFNGERAVVVAPFAHTTLGCGNDDKSCFVDGDRRPCLLYPLEDTKNCGIDLVTKYDCDNQVDEIRTVYAYVGGILSEYADGSGTLKLEIQSPRGVISTRYNYTHIVEDSSRRYEFYLDEYISSGILLGEYGKVGAVGNILHLDTVQVNYVNGIANGYEEPPWKSGTNYEEDPGGATCLQD
jgi:hypothetical protein